MNFVRDSKRILHLGMPMMTARVVGMLVNIIAIAMIAQLGHDVLAASAIGVAIYSTIIMIGYGIIYAVGIIAGRAFGAKEYPLVGQIVRHGVIVAALVSAPVILLFWNVAPLLILFKQDPALSAIAELYLRAMSLSLFPIYMIIVLNQYVVAVSKPRIITTSTLIFAPIGVLLFYMLIFGRFGMPALGIWGMGIGFLVRCVLQALTILIYVASVSYFKQFRFFSRYMKPAYWGKHIVDIFRLGTPMGLQYGGEIGAFAASTFIIGLFGVKALVAQQISFQLIIFSLMIPFTLSESVSILTSQAIGAKQTEVVRWYGYNGCLLTTLVYAAIVIPFILFPRFFMGFYINTHLAANQAVVHLTWVFLIVSILATFFDNIKNILTGALRGLFDAVVPMYIGITSAWMIGIPAGLLMAYPMHIGPIGIKWGFFISFLVAALILWYRFERKCRLHPHEIPQAQVNQ